MTAGIIDACFKDQKESRIVLIKTTEKEKKKKKKKKKNKVLW